MMLKNGDTAITFCLPDENEKKVCLGDFKGKWIVLYFYPKDNTSGCTLEAIDFTRELDAFKKINAWIIGISPDPPKSHCSFREKHDLRIMLLSDEKRDVIEKYNVWVPKKMAGREYYGVERSTFLIDPKGQIAHVWRKVSAKGHVPEVKAKLTELRETV